jgi:hypothetical protein
MIHKDAAAVLELVARAVPDLSAENARLREALTDFLSVAPQVGDYRLALMACKGAALSQEDLTVSEAYVNARDKARAALNGEGE